VQDGDDAPLLLMATQLSVPSAAFDMAALGEESGTWWQGARIPSGARDARTGISDAWDIATTAVSRSGDTPSAHCCRSQDG
jgi:hypothetical protein